VAHPIHHVNLGAPSFAFFAKGGIENSRLRIRPSDIPRNSYTFAKLQDRTISCRLFSMADLYTPRDAAERLGISYSTIKQWLYRGKLRAVKTPGKRIVFSRDTNGEGLAKNADILVAHNAIPEGRDRAPTASAYAAFCHRNDCRNCPCQAIGTVS
jgi:excisionase family DNA binding protein